MRTAIRRACVIVLLSNLSVVWCPAQQPKLAILSTTYERAQVVSWLDSSTFAVSRWDGTLTIFRIPIQGEYGPVLIFDGAAPSLAPIQMIVPISPTSFVTSNDDHSLELWRKENGAYKASATVPHDQKIGIADSGTTFAFAGKTWLVTGHEKGFIALWVVDSSGLQAQGTFPVQSSSPIPSPYPLKNIRGVAYWRDGIVVTGSEDGDLVLFDTTKGAVISRSRYNPAAQRGINSISLSGDNLVVANCSVGNDDKNLWLFQVSRSGFKMLDAVNLKKNAQLPQVFDFSTQLLNMGSQTLFITSTEEGLLWLGSLDQQHLKPIDSTQVSPSGGVAISVNGNGHAIASVAFDIQLVDVTAPSKP
jgi:WD40 repeat protein